MESAFLPKSRNTFSMDGFHYEVYVAFIMLSHEGMFFNKNLGRGKLMPNAKQPYRVLVAD